MCAEDHLGYALQSREAALAEVCPDAAAIGIQGLQLILDYVTLEEEQVQCQLLASVCCTVALSKGYDKPCCSL